MTHEEYARSLRLIADLFENNSELPLPHEASEFRLFSCRTKQDAAVIARVLRNCKKVYDAAFQGSFELTAMIGSIRFRAVFNREEICERRVAGKKDVPAQLIPARAEEYIPAHQEDVYEWHCPEILSDGDAHDPR